MAIHYISRRSTLPPGPAKPHAAPIYVDSDDNLLKMVPAGSGSTEVSILDASTTSQAATGKTISGLTLTSATLTGALVTNAPVSAAAATLTVTAALHAGQTIVMNQSGGTTFTLPAATATGNIYRFVCSVASNANIINADVTGCSMAGGILINDAGDTAAATADFFPTAATSNRITLTTAGGGGATGDWVEAQDILANLWAIRGVFKTSTDPVNPFSHF